MWRHVHVHARTGRRVALFTGCEVCLGTGDSPPPTMGGMECLWAVVHSVMSSRN